MDLDITYSQRKMVFYVNTMSFKRGVVGDFSGKREIPFWI